MKVLIVKISSMGDIIHTLPALTEAFSIIPYIKFDWIVEETFSEIPGWHPAVRRVITVRLRTWIKNWYKFTSWKQYFECVKFVSKEKYDVVIDAQGLIKTSILITSMMTRGQKNGMDSISVREFISSYFYHRRHFIDRKKHAIERTRRLFSYSLRYPVSTGCGEYSIAHLFPLQPNNVIPYLLFLHISSKKEKRWPESYWMEMIQYAVNLGYFVKLPFWRKDEELRVRRWAVFCSAVIILPQLTLGQIAMEISKATAIVSVDTGLSHLAASLGCLNLTLYGPTDPDLVGVYGLNQISLRSETKKMKDLKPAYVWKVFLNKLCNKL